MVLQTPATTNPHISWEALPADFVLPDDPVENIQPPLAAALIDALGAAGLIQPEMLIGSNFALVAMHPYLFSTTKSFTVRDIDSPHQ
jgi:hypothetical protein